MLMLLGLAAVLAAEAAAPGYRFRTTPGGPLPAIDAGVLSAEERAFVAGLPEVRVAVPLPPSQPYEVIDADGEISGIHPDMLLALARTFGLRLRPVVLPDWSSTLQAVRLREVDIVMTLGVTAERMEYLAFTLGATPLPGALFARTGTEPEVPKARFAIERSYMVNDWVRRQYPEASVLTVDTTADALRAVAAGRADVYLGSLLEASDLLRREPMPGVALNRMMSYGTGYYHFGVRKDWAPLAAILNKGIQTLRTRSSDDLAAALGGLPKGARLPSLLATQGAGAALLAAKPVWRVGAVRGLEPLNGVDERGMHEGIAAEYTEQVAQRLGVGVQVQAFDSVAAMLDALGRGEIDLVPFLTRTPQREVDFLYSKPYVEMPYMLVARTDSPLYWNLDSLRGKRLALAARHPLRETLERDYPDIRIVDAVTGNGAMDSVVRQEADAAVEVKLFANLRINSDSTQQLRTVAEVKELPAQFHFAVARANPAMLPLVDQALDAIPKEERMRMLRRWVSVDLHPPFPWRRHAPLIAVASAALLVLGSQAEYGPCSGRIHETTPTCPTTVYGATKLGTGLALDRLASAEGFAFSWLRLFSTYGPADDPSWLIPYVTLQLLQGKRPALTAAEQVWDYLHVDDVAAGVIAAIDHRARGLYNLGSGRAVPLRQIITQVRDQIDPALPLGFGEVPYRPDQVMHLEADIGALTAATGWQPELELADGIASTVAWFRQEGRHAH